MSNGHLYQEAIRRLADLFPPPKPFPIRPSASVVPWRLGADGRTHVYWVKRSASLPVLGGWHVFPGGGVAKSDADLVVHKGPRIAPNLRTSLPVFDVSPTSPDVSNDIVACAVRELFEEIGILASTAARVDQSGLADARRRLLAREFDFAAMLQSLGADIDASALTFAGRWITPPVSPIRFDTRFFLLHWPDDEPVQPSVDGQELAEGEWIAAEDALTRWNRHEILAAPPTLFVLEVLATQGVERGLPRLVQHGGEPTQPIRRFIESRPAVVGLPLITPTLPPARETTSYLIGREEVVLVDVGSPFESEIDRLAGIIHFMDQHFGKKLTAIWITHHHPDHVWGVEPLRRRIDVPVFAHAETAERLRAMGIRVDGFLQDDQQVTLAGNPPLMVRILETPGHAKGHIAVYEEEHGSLIAGDLVAGMGTVLIDPPDGDMDEYLASLRRVRSLRPRTLFPAHGPVIQDATARLDLLIEHRLRREAKVEACWNQGIRQPADIVREAYTDVSTDLHLFAERQVLAHLARLRKHGRIGEG